jgi:ribonuclease HI
MVENFKACFNPTSNGTLESRIIKWNNNNFSSVILNIDGSCLGSPIRVGFGGVLRNYVGFYLSGLSVYIHNSSDILQAELLAIF